MKAVATNIVITIIFVVLIIVTIVAFIPTLRESTVTAYCKREFIEKLDNIKYRACEMNDMDLEFIEKLDTSCIDEISYISENSPEETKVELSFKLKNSNKEYKYDLVCPQGFYGYVFFDFSSAEKSDKLKIEKDYYNFLVSVKKAKLVFCQGYPIECNELNSESDCISQIGCSWDNKCIGEPKSCFDLKESECKQQKGCEIV